MISESRPISSSTAARRSCSSRTVPASLKRGTTIDNWGLPRPLRDMTNAPLVDVAEVVTHQIEALVVDEGARLEIAEQIELALPRRDEPRVHLRERTIDIARVHHQLGDARGHAAQERAERRAAQDAGLHAADEPRRAQRPVAR